MGLTQPFDSFDEAGLFYRAVLGLEPDGVVEVAAPFGLVRTRAVTNPDRSLRLALTASLLRRGGWAPGVPAPQHVAFTTDDVVATGRRLRDSGAPLLAVPANYHDDLEPASTSTRVSWPRCASAGCSTTRTPQGCYLHLYTEVLGSRVFFEVVQRIGGYTGYGTVNSPVRMAAHRRMRISPDRPR